MIGFPLLGIALIIFCSLAILDARRNRFTITSDAFILTDWRQTRTLPFSEVKGFRVDEQKYTFIEPRNELYKRLKIHQYFEKQYEWQSFISNHFKNLDSEALLESEESLMQDESLGSYEEERRETLSSLRKKVRIINYTAVAFTIWVIFFPRPYEWAVYLNLLLPVVVLYFIYRSSGVIRIDEKRNTAYPNASTAFMLPTMAAPLRILLDISVIDYGPIAGYMIVLGLVMYIVVVRVTKAYRTRKEMLYSLLYLMFIGFYSFGAVVHVNAIHDNSVPTVFIVRVADKEISSGKNSRHYLKLEPWGPKNNSSNVAVSRSLYRQTNIGDRVSIYMFMGKLGGKWFLVKEYKAGFNSSGLPKSVHTLHVQN